MKINTILFILATSLPFTALGELIDKNGNVLSQPDLAKLSNILGVSMMSTKSDIDNMIATKGKNWQCKRLDIPENTRGHSTTFARWSRTCTYQNPSNLMQSQRFVVKAVGDTIYHLSFEDRIFDVVSIDEWKEQPAKLKAAYGADIDQAHIEVLKIQDSSSKLAYKEIDSGLKVSSKSYCFGRPFNVVASTNVIKQTNVTTAQFIAEYTGYENMCFEKFRKRNKR
ncbi:hypothetical protein Q4489_05035 [Thalassotalea sp. 1_MG-2023]|uniref:hypothetical protein n=1 Tax=Thalassotalea sp. 1_MG-2023 TaxID=3062680 RepID=UPI0026E1C0D7|nr:hypothetical protein [Thalassotalea sp. 1_MG-2023]MDO6426365.1 hypothetical protein [Thalassotalea sp. 1_MG-2023]